MIFTLLCSINSLSGKISQSSCLASRPVRHAAVVLFAHPFSPQLKWSISIIHIRIFPLSVPALVSNSATQLVSLSSPPCTSFPAPGCDAVTCLPAQADCPCTNVFVHRGDYKETACQWQAAAVSYSSQQFGGTTAGCHGGEAARWPCCYSKPLAEPRPGRISVLPQLLSL